MASEWYTLPNGVKVVTRVVYTHREARGPLALAVTSSISLLAVIAVLVAMAISGFKTRHQFIRSQVGAYFLSLVLSDLLQATGSLMNVKWVIIQGVSTGPFCTSQAALKQIGNVGTALWSLVIAIHTFYLLFLRLRVGDRLFHTILIGVWLFIFFIVLLGPLVLQRSSRGPFWGISGYWCWITSGYRIEQLTDEYLFMFITAGTSFVLYSLIFFRLRGNIRGFGWSLRFSRVKHPWIPGETDEFQMSTAGKQMLWYPVAYTILILPIALCRWSSMFGHNVPYWATMTSDSIFMLSGFVNAILYTTTRKIVSIRAFLPSSQVKSSQSHPSRRTVTSKTYLDSMEFASPISSLPGVKVPYQSSMISVASRGPRHSHSTDHKYLDRFSPDVWEIENVKDRFDSRTYSDGRFEHGRNQQVVITSPPTSVYANHGRTFYHPYSDPRTRPPNNSVIPPDGSDISLATALNHKRFSDWSLHDGRLDSQRSLEGQESLRTELEEMQFAPPSPEPGFIRPLAALPSSIYDAPIGP